MAEFWQSVATAAVVGFVLGGVFGALKLEVPAPATVAGVVGVAAISAGYASVRWLMAK